MDTTTRTPEIPRAHPAAATPSTTEAISPGAAHNERGGKVLAQTDLASAQQLSGEGSVLVDLRSPAACTRHPVQGAIRASDIGRWSARLAHPAHWVLLYGGTDVQCERFLCQLPAGQPVLRVLPTLRRGRSLATGPLSCREGER